LFGKSEERLIVAGPQKNRSLGGGRGKKRAGMIDNNNEEKKNNPRGRAARKKAGGSSAKKKRAQLEGKKKKPPQKTSKGKKGLGQLRSPARPNELQKKQKGAPILKPGKKERRSPRKRGEWALFKEKKGGSSERKPPK